MKKILVWDAPTRILHWGFAAAVSVALGIGFLVDGDNALFRWHMVAGLVALFLLGARCVLGILGTRYARFSSYPLHPLGILRYFRDSLVSKTRRYAGNNPGSALAAVGMFVAVGVLGFTGTGWAGEVMEDPHELAAWVLLACVGLHLTGIAWHTIRHRENIALSMVTGKKAGDPGDGIPSAHGWAGLMVFIAFVAWSAALVSSYTPGAAGVRLPVMGVRVPLGEGDARDGTPGHSPGGREKAKHDDDD